MEGSSLGCHADLLQHCAEVKTEFLFHLALLVWVLDILKCQSRNLSDAFNCVNSGLRRLNEFTDEALDQPVVENVNIGYPRQEGLQCTQTLLEEAIWDFATHLLLQYIQT